MSDWKYKTDGDLRAAGYEFKNVARCSGDTCGAQIEWWKTPQGKMIPLDEGTLQPHWSTCPDAKDYRDKKSPAACGYLKCQLPEGHKGAHERSINVSADATPFRCCMPACQEKTPQQRPDDVRIPMCSAHWQRVPAGLKKTILVLAKGNKPQLLRAAIDAAVKEVTR